MTTRKIAHAAVVAFQKHASNDRSADLTGLSAAVRRWRPGRPVPLSAVAFVVSREGQLGDDPARDHRLMVAMGAAARLAGNPPANGTAVGESLYKAGMSEARLQRLLDADGDRLFAQVDRTARMVAAHNTPFDTKRFVDLLFVGDENLRIKIAQAYLRAKSAKENSDA